jgi:hypothetical protein
VLNDVVDPHNGTFHRSIVMSLNDVTPDKLKLISKRAYLKKPSLKWKFDIGDTARISKYKHKFEKV